MITFDHAVINLSGDGRRKLSAAFQLKRGDFALLLGLNGAGKTTLLDSIVGVRHPTSGRVEVSSASSPIAYAVQDSASGLLPWRNVLDNILFPAALCHQADSEMQRKAASLLREFRLEERRDDFPYRLSEGEKQIINVIRCLCTPGDVVLLDEPFAALNSHAKVKAKALLAKLAAERITILVTHDPADCDLPFNRFFLISDSAVSEIDSRAAKEFLSNVISKA